MSYLRLFGLIMGVLGIMGSFINYRGVKWDRGHFVTTVLLATSVLIISLDPNIANFLPAVFDLQDSSRGRLLALMVVAILLLFFLYSEHRSKLVKLNRQFDDAIRRMSINAISENIESYLKPIMVLIPAYNEADNLSILLKRIPKVIGELEVGCLVVDDGSSDNTAEIVRQHNYLVVSNLVNRGQGSASRLGYEILQRDQVKAIVTLDADNQHDPSEIKNLIEPILEGKSQLVIGSRRLGSATRESVIRSFGIHFLTRLINFISGTKLTDCSSGYKAFCVSVFKRIRLYEDQYQATEVIIESAKKGVAMMEVPISITPRKYGETKKGNNWQYGYRFLKVLIKSWWR